MSRYRCYEELELVWAREVVARLLDLREYEGHTDFDIAWNCAAYDVRLRARLRAPLTGHYRDDDEAISFAAFFRSACEREWKGEETIDYRGLSLGEESDDSNVVIRLPEVAA